MLVAQVLNQRERLSIGARWNAHTAALRWRWHQRQLQQPSVRAKGIANHGGPRLLLLTQADRVSQSQIFPFHFYRAQMAKELGLGFRECLVSSALADENSLPPAADLIILQLWMDAGAEVIDSMFALIKRRYGAAPVVFLDPLSPTDLRMAERLGDRVDLYVKKHLLKDRSAYQLPTRGETNLTDWYGPHYGHELPSTRFVLPDRFFEKLMVGPTFCTAAHLLPGFCLAPRPPSASRGIDLHVRLGGTKVANSWYGDMRRAAHGAADVLRDLVVTPAASVSRAQFLNELADSKMAWSPFGYGEVCWRDFEAIHRGAVLIKQDSSHLDITPNIFVANETYVPVAWDFSDLAEKVRYLARSPSTLSKIRDAAFQSVREYVAGNRFVNEFMVEILESTSTSRALR